MRRREKHTNQCYQYFPWSKRDFTNVNSVMVRLVDKILQRLDSVFIYWSLGFATLRVVLQTLTLGFNTPYLDRFFLISTWTVNRHGG